MIVPSKSRAIFGIIALAWLLFQASGCRGAGGRPVFTNEWSFNGGTYINVVAKNDLVGVPKWRESAAPPLSPGRTAELAGAKLASIVRNVSGWTIANIVLEHVETEGTWLYVVKFATSEEGASSVDIVVLLDGRVILPEKE